MLVKLALTFWLIALAAGSAAASTIAPGLAAHLDTLGERDVVKVLVVLKDRPDVVALDRNLHAAGAARSQRHREVVASLRRAAARAQTDLLAELAADKASGEVVGAVPHWIVNSVVVTATVAQVRRIAARTDVDRIEADLQVEAMAPVSVKTDVAAGDKDAQGFVTPGLAAINAPRVWHELGIDGTGTIVANLDSGVDGTHPTLAARWRGRVAPAAECWHDGADVGSPGLPVDFYGHGTHTMGTITGASGVDTIGVAPGALWIASNAIWSDQGLDNPVIQAFEWLADPDGDPATTDDVPDVVQNSWGVTAAGGVYLDCDTRWWDVIDNCEAAGVVVLWSAGNEGPGPGTLRSPPNRASTPTSSFAIGSTRATAPFMISSFSSRGPSQCGGPFAVKPEVVAPGQDILSAYPGGVYAYMSGTSMAGPHVAGVVALMRQARPDLDAVTIKEILMETAVDLGLPGEDNDYGHGIVDAYAAVLVALNEIGTVVGTVTDAADGHPLADVLVRDTQGLISKTTGADGAYGFTLRTGERVISLEKFGYVTSQLTVTVPTGETLVRDVALARAPWSRISGTVTGPDGAPYAGAEIAVLGVSVDPVQSGPDGAYEILLPSGEGLAYVLKAMAPDLAYDLRHVGLEHDVVTDFTLPQIRSDGFESGGLATYPYAHAGDAPWTVTTEQAQEGAFSARSGAIGHGQVSVLSLDYYVNGDGPFSFWLTTDSETAYDNLVFSVDGVDRGSWSGATPWTRFSMDLAAGLHTFRWTYRKDSSVSVGRDGAWIDLIAFPGTGVQPRPRVDLAPAELSLRVDAGMTGEAQLVISNTGDYRLEFTLAAADTAAGGGSPPAWLAFAPATGTVHPHSDTIVTISCDGGAAPSGVHRAILTVSSNDPTAPTVAVPVSVSVDAVSAVGDAPPARPSLRGAVPNPFNPATDIHYSLPGPARVDLSIYDVAGRLVRTLVAEPRPAGAHSERWNGRDETGRAAASGVYFVRLRVADVAEIKPMTLVR